MSEVRLEAISVSYGETMAVRGLDLTIAEGEVVAVLGPSGCGKSTLLRAIAGLEPLAGGTVRVGGRDLAGVPTHKRGVGLMFQDHALFAHMTVAGNVGFGLRMAKWAPADRESRVAEMLALVGLPSRGGATIDQLSGGERQRVALARTLAPRPAVVLLDEPLGSLDRALRRELIGTLGRAFRETHATVLHVTHDRDEALMLGHRVAVMRDGRLAQIGSPAELMADPADDWVAGFLE